MRSIISARPLISVFVLSLAVANACGQASPTSGATGIGADAQVRDTGGDVELAEVSTFDGPTCASTCGAFSSGSSSGPYACDPTGACVQCVSDAPCVATFGGLRPACIPDETCGCNQDSQCTGQGAGARCVTGLGECGCLTSADCPGPPVPVCDTATSLCVECLTGADCTDPDKAACGGNGCSTCITSSDCATNGAGPICIDGDCTCADTADCVGRGEGPNCLLGYLEQSKECSCAGASDCVSSAEGHACVNQTTLTYVGLGYPPSTTGGEGWLQCGCATDADCPVGTACQTTIYPQYRCRPMPSDGGVSKTGASDAQPD